MCACELHAPICQSSQAVWQDVNGNFCFLLCVWRVSCCVRGQREERDGEIDGDGVRTLKRKKDFHSGFSSCAWIQ